MTAIASFVTAIASFVTAIASFVTAIASFVTAIASFATAITSLATRLAPQQREALRLWLIGYDTTEMVVALGVGDGRAVAHLLNRALENLRYRFVGQGAPRAARNSGESARDAVL